MSTPLPEDPRIRLDALFEQALDLEGEQRAAFLADLSAREPALHDRLLALLAMVDAPTSVLAPEAIAGGALWQALAAARPEEHALPPDTQIGAWRLLQPLGQGGMGTVYLVERVAGEFQQRGALKLIRSGIDSEEFLRRFAQERQILARMNHPGIAGLLDGGRDRDGRPYLVMEYVDGRSLDRYCDEEALPLERRLALFAQVGQAVAHAHRHLVVHRDIKPSNIRVTSEGQVKLLDFGIAKVLGDTDVAATPQTRTVARMFTPEYATPEQVAGQPVTTATDVYQLGLLLYELLCGQRAQRLDDDAPATLQRVVHDGEPPRPSAMVSAEAAVLRGSNANALRRRLRGDLDNIVAKALRKAPERRYASVVELLDDLERWRRGLPVRARPERLGYRTTKFVGRHPFGVAAAAATVLLLFAYAVTVTLQADIIARERDRARAEAQKAQQVQALVLRLFEGADPERSGGARLSARELLDRGWAGIEADLGDHPDVRLELVQTVGEAYRQLGLYDRAEALFDQGLRIVRLDPARDPARHARALQSLGRLRTDQGRFAEAEALLREALQRLEPAPDTPLPEVATLLGDLGSTLFQNGQPEAAEALYRESLATRRALFGNEHADVADSLGRLGLVLRHRGEYAAAEPLLSEALALRRRLLPPTHPDLGASLSDLALVRTDLGELDSAEALYNEALALMRAAYGERHPHVATVMNNLARLLQTRRQNTEALALLREALAIRRETLGERHPNVGLALNDLGLALVETGDVEEAEEAYRQALDAYGADHPWRASTVYNLGRIAEQRGEYAVAEAHYRETLAAQRAYYGEDHDRISVGLNRLGIVLHRQGRMDEAEAHLRLALEILHKRLPERHPRFAAVLLPLGLVLRDRDRHGEAEPLLREAWQLRHDAYGADDVRTAEALLALRGQPAPPRTAAR